jgi:hypothetical protein
MFHLKIKIPNFRETCKKRDKTRLNPVLIAFYQSCRYLTQKKNVSQQPGHTDTVEKRITSKWR